MKTIILLMTLVFVSGCGRSTIKVKLDSCEGIKRLGWAECREWEK
jgi:hypothetical protein